MVEKLTHAEHDARAMLLGLVYDWRDGTYCNSDGESRVTTMGMIDAMTLEPISQSVALHRANEWAVIARNGGWARKLTFNCRPETPYAKAEE